MSSEWQDSSEVASESYDQGSAEGRKGAASVTGPTQEYSERVIRADAEQERLTLIQQEIRHHSENVQTEMRRFKEAMDHVERTYLLRLTAITDLLQDEE